MKELIAYRVDLVSALQQVIRELPQIAASPALGDRYPSILPDKTSLHYVLFHLRELESQVFSAQLPRFVSEDIPTIPIFDDEAWMMAHYNPKEPVSTIVDQIVELRKSEVGWLQALAPTAWSRTARHPWWGVHTLQWWVELQVDYSYQHLKIISPSPDI